MSKPSGTPRTDEMLSTVGLSYSSGYRELQIVEAEFARQLERDLAVAQERIDGLEERLHEIVEIYAGMEGFTPQTAPEDYQQRIIKQMYEIAARREPK